MSHENWDDHQESEKSFWGDCSNTHGEEQKQLIYMSRMGFKQFHDGNTPYNYDGTGLSILDIGGGPVSPLLKFKNTKRRVVQEPCEYPEWVQGRYRSAQIELFQMPGEIMFFNGMFDLVFIMNCLQHTKDPAKIINNALRALVPGGKLHMFEWIDIPAHQGHPQCLTQENLDAWTGMKGTVETIKGDNECFGKCWYV